MLEVRRILCPVDFSDASRHAFDHAIAIADWYGSRITALHVFSPTMLPDQSTVLAGLPTLLPLTDDDRRAVEARLRQWVESPGGARTTDILLEEGYNPAVHILERAVSLAADLIVMGTHGRSGFDRAVLGSVAEKVLRKASCPMLTVPPPVVRAAKPPYARLLCPIDFSPSSIAAFQFACSLAKESDAELTLMHVLDDSSPTDGDWPVEQFDTPAYRAQRTDEARRRLDALITDDIRTWARPSIHASYGKPYRRILVVAQEEHVDLIVMGVHGRNPFDMLLMGSTTNQVVRRAPCPVLTLKQSS
jgi:CPA2 family monovalent cation:H+ antiporter-2